MRTPAGKECRYFYGDYYRGRHYEECRLLASAKPPLQWRPSLCSTCPVPGILMANACPNLVLQASLVRPFPFLQQKVDIRPYCVLTKTSEFDPHVGCGECHRLPDIFNKIDDPDTVD
jgi:hypothetical protein